jgi:peptide/nickel transport system substrate-binding protein
MLPGLTLHNGESLDAARAAEILRSFVSSPDKRRSFPALTDVTSIEAKSDTELVFSLARHSWWLPEDLSTPLSIEENGIEIGTGPYQLVEKNEANVVLRRFDAYHGGRPGIGKVIVRTDSTLRTAWASLLRGEVDVVVDLPPDTVELIGNEKNARIIAFPRPYQYIIAFNLRLRKFSDPRIRQALNMAIDRAAVVENVLKGAGAPSAGPIWHRHWAADSEASAVPFAPRRAEALLDAAGLKMVPSLDPREAPTRLRLTCLVPEGFIVYEHLALEVQRQLSDVGVDMRFEVQSFEKYDERATGGDFEAVMVDITSGFSLSRSSIFWRSPKRPEVLDAFGYENPETESLFEQLRAAGSDSAVRSVVSRLQDAFRRNPPAIFLAWNERARTFRGGFPITAPPGTDPLPRLWEWGAQVSDRTATR